MATTATTLHDNTTDTQRAGRREWVALAVLALPTLLLSIDLSVLYLALPMISEDLGPTATQQLWILDIYGFMVAGFLITMGTLGDRIGRRKLLLIGAAGFAAASTLAAYSSSPEMLIVARALMGVTGATLMPSTLALISNLFTDPHQRATAISVWLSCFMGGMVVGPLVGGLMLAHAWWGSVFLLALPVMALLFLAAPWLPEYRDPDPGRLDLASVGLSLAAILPVIYGLKEIARYGVEASSIAAIGVGLVVGWTFVRRQLSLSYPLIDVRLFRRPAFSSAVGINVAGGMVMAGSFLLISLYLQLVLDLSPIQAGLWLVPGQIVMIAASLATPHLAKRFKTSYVMTAGMLIGAVGFALLTQTTAPSAGGADTPLVMVPAFALCAAGIAMPTSLIINLIVGSVPPAKAGAASAISETSGEFGIALGVALVGSLSTALYRAGLVVPDGVPATAADQARESLGGAAAAADSLPSGVASSLLDNAREAFTSGIGVVSTIGALVFLAMAVVTFTQFRESDEVAPATDSSG